MITPPQIPSFFKKFFIVNLPDGSLFVVSAHALICLAITTAVLTILFLLLRFSKWGLGVRTTASNEYVAQMMGINTYAITAISWGIAGGLGVLAALMYTGSGVSIRDPYFMTDFQVNAFLAGILGGFGTFYGPLISAVLLPVVKCLLGLLAYIPGFETITRWDQTIVLILVMICIYIKPNGLFGKKIVKKV
jgi:branched-chain amino acid transport system permease protein